MTVKILQGDCIDVMRGMDADSVDCCVTSPPYWGLRDYGVDGQMGLERSLGEHIETMVRVFEEVKRILKPTGTIWLNYGDCYASTPNGRSAADTKAAGGDDRTFRDKPFSTIGGIFKPKDLLMIPNRLAIALQESGWWVRSEIIWGKPNPMPESIKDRPATAHEKIFLLTKAQRYFYDHEAVRPPMAAASLERLAQNIEAQEGSHRANGGRKTNGTMKAVSRKDERHAGFHERFYHGAPAKKDKQAGHGQRHAGFNERYKENGQAESGTRNLKNYEAAPVQVWEMSTQPFSGAHFATMPPELAERCIKAGCPKDGIVFDPFGGAGTTGLVAAELGRSAVLVELNPEYIQIARDRIKAGLHRVKCDIPEKPSAGPLFEIATEKTTA